eukprot:TRINITY_DN25166_c0_g1_i1.p1 TRINITY_DN25166_c0_g1~~TRINITY_DN25166_c0_g1_i1.p1  ORF type:complete len:629 (-),score=108.14 TRINITY_DN25166_c0_g1_i1:562-2400(-)
MPGANDVVDAAPQRDRSSSFGGAFSQGGRTSPRDQFGRQSGGDRGSGGGFDFQPEPRFGNDSRRGSTFSVAEEDDGRQRAESEYSLARSRGRSVSVVSAESSGEEHSPRTRMMTHGPSETAFEHSGGSMRPAPVRRFDSAASIPEEFGEQRSRMDSYVSGEVMADRSYRTRRDTAGSVPEQFDDQRERMDSYISGEVMADRTSRQRYDSVGSVPEEFGEQQARDSTLRQRYDSVGSIPEEFGEEPARDSTLRQRYDSSASIADEAAPNRYPSHTSGDRPLSPGQRMSQHQNAQSPAGPWADQEAEWDAPEDDMVNSPPTAQDAGMFEAEDFGDDDLGEDFPSHGHFTQQQSQALPRGSSGLSEYDDDFDDTAEHAVAPQWSMQDRFDSADSRGRAMTHDHSGMSGTPFEHSGGSLRPGRFDSSASMNANVADETGFTQPRGQPQPSVHDYEDEDDMDIDEFGGPPVTQTFSQATPPGARREHSARGEQQSSVMYDDEDSDMDVDEFASPTVSQTVRQGGSPVPPIVQMPRPSNFDNSPRSLGTPPRSASGSPVGAGGRYTPPSSTPQDGGRISNRSSLMAERMHRMMTNPGESDGGSDLEDDIEEYAVGPRR